MQRLLDRSARVPLLLLLVHAAVVASADTSAAGGDHYVSRGDVNCSACLDTLLELPKAKNGTNQAKMDEQVRACC